MSDSIESFPAEAQDMIRRLREEAAGHRVAKQEAVKELETARSQIADLTAVQDAHEKLLTEHASLTQRSDKVSALLESNYSGPAALELADRIRGDKPEEWLADAEKLSKLFAPAAVEKKSEPVEAPKPDPLLDPSAGSATPLNADPTVAKLESLFGA